MKKFIALLLSLCLLIAVCASAETYELDKNTKTGTSTVSLTITTVDSYTVVIPSGFEIDPETRYGYGTITLKAGYILGGNCKNLYVRLTSAENGIRNGYRGSLGDITLIEFQNFTMKSENGKTCDYAIKASGKQTPFTTTTTTVSGTTFCSPKSNLISASYTGDNSNDKTCDLTFYVYTLPVAGTYTDTLTFSIVTTE